MKPKDFEKIYNKFSGELFGHQMASDGSKYLRFKTIDDWWHSLSRDKRGNFEKKDIPKNIRDTFFEIFKKSSKTNLGQPYNHFAWLTIAHAKPLDQKINVIKQFLKRDPYFICDPRVGATILNLRIYAPLEFNEVIKSLRLETRGKKGFSDEIRERVFLRMSIYLLKNSRNSHKASERTAAMACIKEKHPWAKGMSVEAARKIYANKLNELSVEIGPEHLDSLLRSLLN